MSVSGTQCLLHCSKLVATRLPLMMCIAAAPTNTYLPHTTVALTALHTQCSLHTVMPTQKPDCGYVTYQPLPPALPNTGWNAPAINKQMPSLHTGLLPRLGCCIVSSTSRPQWCSGHTHTHTHTQSGAYILVGGFHAVVLLLLCKQIG